MMPVLRAAYVIARRDFTALVFSKAFLFFLIGPLLMFGIAVGAGSLGSEVAHDTGTPVIGAVMPEAAVERLAAARATLGRAAPLLPRIEAAQGEPATLLRTGRDGRGYAAILTGTLDRPTLHATEGAIRGFGPDVRLLLADARDPLDPARVPLATRPVAMARAVAEPDRMLTAQIGQTVLFLLTMLLAGMVLSNLVEEKANKIIEILAASVPLESIFLGKLFAMLAMAWLGIAVWGGAAALLILASGSALPSLPPPAVGWPVFLLLGILYFSTAYMVLGSLFLGIGAMASTVREVQTLSMPVTMGHLGVFLLATYTLSRMGQPVELVAAIVPFSSPFVMLARAAQQPALWTQGIAILWQCLATWAMIRVGTAMFRRNVLKSGGGGKRRRPSRKPALD